MQHFGKGALRVAKNYTKGYSDTQAKVRDATSNDPWGPSGTQMNEIAQMTYNQNDFVEIMEMLDKRLNDKGKNWRHVFKSLTVLDYCLHAGSENVVIYFRDNIYIIKTLKEFQYLDEYGKDQGANVRQKAKDITNLLQDEGRLREQRRSRAHMRDRMIRGGHPDDLDEDENELRRHLQGTPQGSLNGRRPNKDEDELRRAIEESKRSLAEEQAKKGAKTAEEQDLEKAIRLSEEEEAKRNKAVEDSNANALFDDQNQQQPVHTNAVPFLDPTPYATGLQPQFTQMQPQFTSFNPYQQQAQQEAMQAEYLRQQQEWQRQQELAAQQAQAQAQQEEWMRQQQMLQWQQQQQQQQFQPQQAPLAPQPTGFGSNNPFAPASASPAPPVPSFPSSLSPSSSSGPSFNLQGTYANSSSTPSYSSSPAPSSQPSSTSPAPSTKPPRGSSKADQEHSQLANFLANRDDGQDTFGNVGALRYGNTSLAAQVIAQKTGSHNPFQQQQQQQQQQQHSSEQPFFSI